MPNITLNDGSKKKFLAPVTVQAVAESIGAGLASATLAGEVDGRLVDTNHVIDRDARVHIITAKDAAGLDIIRHSAAHLLAHAVKTLYPQVQVTIGPVIENGFYYDFATPQPFTPEDLEKIEAQMHVLAKTNHAVVRRDLGRDEAIELFSSLGEKYKVEIIKDIPPQESLSVYQQGDFVDLCRGPHVPRTGLLKAFKLTKLAGAYWRGDSRNVTLQRIYGTAWPDKKSLQAYLKRLQEAEQRDHRLLAKKMDLFHFQAEAPGSVFWHPNGWAIFQAMCGYIRDFQQRHGYQEIHTPTMMDVALWQRSGHLEKFDQGVFTSRPDSEQREYAIKPMSCPGHVQIFKQGVKSYRDLPIRYAEFGSCHRNEPSGTLHGLMRLRAFVQDDAHIFCTETQIAAEVSAFIDQMHEVYADFGFIEVIHKLSTRPEKRVGSDALWDKGEQALADALNAKGVEWELLPGEGAFYGPKIEFSLRDCLDRIWQCGTIQVDFSIAERLGAHYITEDGSKKPPVMLHRAMLGSVERFLGIVLEQYAGQLPLWLAPVQVVVMNITDQQADYVRQVTQNLQNLHLRVKSDLRNEKIGFKIREHTIARVPYQVVVGEREMNAATLAVRLPDNNHNQIMRVDQLAQRLQAEIKCKGRIGGAKHQTKTDTSEYAN